jgi:prolyl-tRNA synthetase
MKESFELFRGIYARIFERVGLEDVLSVQADSGSIGGDGSAEFMVVSEVGEDTLLVCERCDYGANVEKAESRIPEPPSSDPEMTAMRVEATPGITSVEQLSRRFAGLSPASMVKTVICTDLTAEPDEDLVAVCIRADLNVEEVKLGAALGGKFEMTAPERIERATGARVGFAGPIGLRGVARLEFDRSVEGMRNFLCGVNRTDTHALGVNLGRDLPVPSRYIDVHAAQGGHGCPSCRASLIEKRGIEVGHVFQLQKGYSTSLGATYSRPDGREEVAWMGCYGIGTTRLLQAIAEDTHDEHGLRWPVPVAPYDAGVVLARPSDGHDPVLEATVREQRAAGLRVLVDDRSGSAGVKLKDADLVGCPVRVVVGRRADEGIVEVRGRSDRREFDVELGGVATAVAGLLDRAGAVLV